MKSRDIIVTAGTDQEVLKSTRHQVNANLNRADYVLLRNHAAQQKKTVSVLIRETLEPLLKSLR